MANFTMSYFSPSLRFNTTLDVFVPDPRVKENMTYTNKNKFYEEDKCPVLFLLQDVYKDSTDILNYRNIFKVAQSKQMVVVIPSLGNNFYDNWFKNPDYNDFLTRELPPYIQKYFSVSREKNNTYIGGIGMGGYGAFTLSLSNPDVFSYAFSLQGTSQLDKIIGSTFDKNQINFENKNLKIYLNCKADDPFFNQYLTKLSSNNYQYIIDTIVDCTLDIALTKILDWIKENKENCNKGVQCG